MTHRLATSQVSFLNIEANANGKFRGKEEKRRSRGERDGRGGLSMQSLLPQITGKHYLLLRTNPKIEIWLLSTSEHGYTDKNHEKAKA